jgi:hypothetical protein
MDTLILDKTCTDCGQAKVLGEFYKDNRGALGVMARCKSCHKTKVAGNNTLKRTGVSPEKYAELLFLQGGVCAICKGECYKKLSVDHDHETGEVRGLLCHSCNTAVGLLLDDPQRLEAAAAYLRKESV